jgi:cell division initiation protein
MAGASKDPQDEAEPASGSEERRVTPIDIQQRQFRLAFRGYNERDVDRFLDELTEEVARLHSENKRLREEMQLKGTAPVEVAGATQADQIVRRAREHAARILAEARAEAGAVTGSPGAQGTDESSASSSEASQVPEAVSRFLAREREFLQTLASHIQGHAEAVKEDLRQIREEGPSTPPPGRLNPGGGHNPGAEGRGGNPSRTSEPPGTIGDAWVLGGPHQAEPPGRSDDPWWAGGASDNLGEGPAGVQAGQSMGMPTEASQPPSEQVASQEPPELRHPLEEGQGKTAGPAPEVDSGWATGSSARNAGDLQPPGEPTIRELFWGED